MNKITKTTEEFLSFIVGTGLICFFSFVLLLASAKLNDSLLGDLLASLAGETARTARTESFSYWGRIGGEVLTGLGVSSGGTTVLPTPTPAVVAATQPPATSTGPQPTTSPNATATPLPSSYIRESPISVAGVLLWRGLDTQTQQVRPTGVDLRAIKSQITTALTQNSGDLTALWLQKRLDACDPSYQAMLQAAKAGEAVKAIAEADKLLGCNPRAVVAYVAKRWADIRAWPSSQSVDPANPIIWPSDETQADKLLDGFSIGINDKIDGPARGFQAADHIAVTVLDTNEFGFGQINVVLTVATLDRLLGAGKWELRGGPYAIGQSRLFPDPTTLPEPNPAVPTNAELTPPQTVTAPDTNAPAGAGGGAEDVYVVQGGDTANSIARKYNITLEALIAANPTTLGVNPNFLQVGQTLNIP